MARDPGRLGCAAESLIRDEPMLGTASRVRRWLAVEQPGAWGREAVLESKLDDEVARTLTVAGKAHGVRVLLIRRAGRTDPSAERSAFLVRSDRVHRWIERVRFTDATRLAGLDLGVLGGDEPPGIGEPGPEHLHLVCTNGRHDPCCADFGRPVVRALTEAGVDVWESSHVGGDRFAANVVCLPTGIYFGRVPAEGSVRLLADHAAGLIDLDHYRGRSCYPPALQAAEVFARRELGERRLDALRFGPATHDGARVDVVLHHDDGRRVHVALVREQGAPEALTCADLHTSRPTHHRLVDISVVA